MSQLQSGQAASKFTPDELRQYRDQFQVFDLNKDGVISVPELANVSRKIGYRLSAQTIKNVMKSHDLDENGVLSFDEFLQAMPLNLTNIPRQEHKMAEVRRMFLQYDKDNNGFVSISEAHDVLRHEMAFSATQSIQLVKKYDKNNDGHLDYEEFAKFYTSVKNRTEEFKMLFEHFDKDGSASISCSEAKDMLRQLNIPEADVEILVDMYDKDKDGELQYPEFVSFLVNS